MHCSSNTLNLLASVVGLWGLVNNAGVLGPSGHIGWLAASDYEYPLKVNLLGMVEMNRVFLPLLVQGNGRIVNMTSVMGRVAACIPPYCASKFAAEGYSDILRLVRIKKNVNGEMHYVLEYI